MNRQDAKPRRPSLMAGPPAPAAAGSVPARILADMDGGTSAVPRRASSLPMERRLVTGLLVIGLLWLLGLLWWWQSGRAEGGLPPQPGVAGHGDPPSRERTPGSASGAAVIIDEPSAAAETSPQGLTAQTIGGDGADQEPLASPFARRTATSATTPPGSGQRNPFGAPTAAVRPAAAATKGATQAAETAGPRGDRSEPDLMATLLGNIQATAHEPSGLDSLIRTMEDDATRAAESGQQTTAAGQASRSQQIQTNLRACPPANTAKGLKCRQDICAVYAGRDPACPAN